MSDARQGFYNCYSRSHPEEMVNPETGMMDRYYSATFEYFQSEDRALRWAEKMRKHSKEVSVSFNNAIIVEHRA